MSVSNANFKTFYYSTAGALIVPTQVGAVQQIMGAQHPYVALSNAGVGGDTGNSLYAQPGINAQVVIGPGMTYINGSQYGSGTGAPGSSSVSDPSTRI